jgi:hypothetical protein
MVINNLSTLPGTVPVQNLKRRNMKQTIGILRNSKSKILEHENREFDLSSERRRSTNSTSSSVSFENITIREYAVCIGDNPSCSSGAPIR